MQTLNSQRQGMIYEGVKKMMVQKGINGLPQPGYLRMETLTVNAQGTYPFILSKNVGNPTITENRLDQNDAFVASHTGIYLMAQNPATPGTGVLQTYPNQIVFAAEAGNLNPDHLECFWNGYLYVKVDDTVFVESGWLRPSRVVRTAQQTAATDKSEAIELDGLFEQTPIITFDGSKKNTINAVIPAFNGQQVQYGTSSLRVSLVLVFWGFLVTGGSNIGNLSF